VLFDKIKGDLLVSLWRIFIVVFILIIIFFTYLAAVMSENPWLYSLLILLAIACFIISLVYVYRSLKIQSLVIITNAFLTVAIIFITNRIYEDAAALLSDGILAAFRKFELDPVLSVFSILLGISGLMLLIACAVLVNMIPERIKVQQRKDQNKDREEK
jgi:hypothetical protein